MPLFDDDQRAAISAEEAAWEAGELAAFLARQPEQRDEYLTRARRPVRRVYTPADLGETAFADIGFPGRYPYTRGPYPTMYRGRNWTMRQIAGFGQAHETNARFRYLIEQGQTGLSVDFDMPTLMGLDSDDPRCLGEVGREGVAVDVIDDMRELFDGIDLETISVSMTINPSAWILLAMYVAVAEERGCDLDRLSGTIQNDILKEYIAQKEWIYPIRPSLRIVRDTIVWSARHLARYNPVNISGYHISEAGGDTVAEIAFTLANAVAYVEEVTATGLPVDEFAPRLSFFFVSQADFFEEVAKFRAVRRAYARIMKERFGAQKPESMRLRFHAQTAAASLTRAQPMNNIVRTALQALAAVLGGAQSLHTNGLDEAYSIPTEFAMKMALRTQQIIAHETNVTNVVDPLGGSWYVETLTNELEAEVFRILDHVDSLGGTVRAIEQGYFQQAQADYAYDVALRKASGEDVVVGVNRFVETEADPAQAVETHRLDPESERRQVERLRAVRAARDQTVVDRLLKELTEAARDPAENLMPATIAAVKAQASMGEIVNALRDVFGTYVETPVF
ncbi:MAG TPA: methylmalonyl-CoA mutase family protein [Acidimicrobiia bacterium]